MAIFQIVNEGRTLVRKDNINGLEIEIRIPIDTLLAGPIGISNNPPERFGVPYIPNKAISLIEPIMFLETKDTREFPLGTGDLKDCVFNFVAKTLQSSSYAEMLTGKEIQT